MKVLLMAVVNRISMTKSEEIGICSIAAYLRTKDYQVEIMCEYDDAVDYSVIEALNPDFIGFPVYSLSEICVSKVAEKVKALLPNIKICVGGVVPTYDGEKLLKQYPFIDFAIVGEGELVVHELLLALENKTEMKGIKGLIYRENGNIINNAGQQYIMNLDDIPSIARDMLKESNSSAYISSIRGCRGNCSFCSSKLFKGPIRTKSPRIVADEIEYVHKKYGKKYFSITDGSFEDSTDGTYDRIMELSVELRKRNLDIYYNTFMRSGFYKNSTDELMKSLLLSGMYMTFVGAEAGNEADLKLYNKLATMEDNYNIVRYLNEKKVYADIGFISFNPYSSFSRILTNINFLYETGFLFDTFKMTSKMNLYRGTRICEQVLNDNKIIKINELDYSFMDPRILTLFGRINKYVLKGNREYNNIFEQIRQHGRKFKSALTAALIDALRKEHPAGSEQIEYYFNSCKTHIQHVNDKMKDFYESIVASVKNSSPEKDTDNIFEVLINDELLKTVESMKRLEQEAADKLSLQ